MGIRRLAIRIANRLLLFVYVAVVRIWQQPSIISERRPQFLADEVISPAQGHTYALAVKYSLFGLDDGFLDLLDALKRQGVNTVVVLNGKPTEVQLAQVRHRAHRILVRRNLGRDFGAYRAGTLQLLRDGVNIDRLLYFNDSVIYLAGVALDQMIGSLKNTAYDMMGALENHENNHHVGSFAFSLSGRVLGDRTIQEFWRRYKTYDLRPHAIVNGEIKLSASVKRCGFSIDVIYSSVRMALSLDRLSFNELVSLLRYVPAANRSSSAGRLLGPSLDMAATLQTSKRRIASTGRNPTTSALSQYRAGAGKTRRTETWDIQRDELLTREALIDQLLGSFIYSSQVHFGFGLFHRVLQCPLVKKDLLARGIYLEQECARILEELPPAELHGIIRELVNRGRPVKITGMRRFRLANGLI